MKMVVCVVVLLAIVALPAIGNASADEPRVYGRGDTVVVDLKALPLAPIDERRGDILPAGAQRALVGEDASSLDLVQWPAGSAVPPQSRALYWTGLLLEGQLAVTTRAEAAPHVMTAPSFLMIPAGIKHSVRCAAAADCILLLFQAGPHNSVTFESLPEGKSVGEPDGLPPYFQDLADTVWSSAGPKVWKGAVNGPAWLTVGADFAELWRLEPGARVVGCVGTQSKHRVGVVLRGSMTWTPPEAAVPEVQGTYYQTPRTWTCTCTSASGCDLLAH